VHLRDYATLVRRRWWIIALAGLVALATSFAVARSQAPVYRSSVKLEVNGRIDYSQIMAIDKLLRQLAARITTTTVADAVSQRLGAGVGADELLGKLHTQAFTDTLHIQIDADDSDPVRAERIAATFAAVVQERQAAAMAAVPEQERVNVSVLDRATPGRLFAPQTRALALGGGLLGLLVGLILVIVLDYMDETFRGASDVERSLGLPVIGIVPSVSPPPRRGRVREGGAQRTPVASAATGQGSVAPSPARREGERPL
jgi:polysaccharide biosynthesis transport protein